MIESPNDTFSSNLAVFFEVLLYLASRMAKLQPGEVLAFDTSDPGALDEIPPWCDLRGYTLLESDTLPEGRWRFLIRK